MSQDGHAHGRRVIEFDIDRYLPDSRKVDLSGVDWDDVANRPLAAGDVMCLHRGDRLEEGERV